MINTVALTFQDFTERILSGDKKWRRKSIGLYQAAYRYLEHIKPEEVWLEDNFYGDNRDYTSLKEVYISFMSSAQNYQRMPNITAFNKWKTEISENAAFCEAKENAGLRLKGAYDVPQIYTAHHAKTKEKYISFLEETKSLRKYIGGVHL